LKPPHVGFEVDPQNKTNQQLKVFRDREKTCRWLGLEET
jgi:hypothetical protein